MVSICWQIMFGVMKGGRSFCTYEYEKKPDE